MAPVVDARFAKLHTDPRFVRPKAAKNKVVVDARFKQFFDDDSKSTSSFAAHNPKLTYFFPAVPESSGKKGAAGNKVDKYGRPLEKDSTGNDLKRYYRIESPEPGAVEGEGQDEESGEDSGEEESEQEDDDDATATGKAFVDFARGEGGVESSDEEGANPHGSDSDDSDSEGSVTLGPATLRRPARRSPSIDLSETELPPTFGDDSDAESIADSNASDDATPSRRLAVVNMDWDHLRAVDLYRVLASSLSLTAPAAPAPSKAHQKKFDDSGEEVGPYKPPSRLVLAKGRLLNLRIYPSMFGRERMEREAREGPPTDVFAAAIANEEASDDGETMVLGRAKPKPKQRRGKGKKKRAGDESESESDEEITEKDIVREQVEDGAEDYDGEALRRYQLERLRCVSPFPKVCVPKADKGPSQQVLLRYRHVRLP